MPSDLGFTKNGIFQVDTDLFDTRVYAVDQAGLKVYTCSTSDPLDKKSCKSRDLPSKAQDAIDFEFQTGPFGQLSLLMSFEEDSNTAILYDLDVETPQFYVNENALNLL